MQPPPAEHVHPPHPGKILYIHKPLASGLGTTRIKLGYMFFLYELSIFQFTSKSAAVTELSGNNTHSSQFCSYIISCSISEYLDDKSVGTEFAPMKNV